MDRYYPFFRTHWSQPSHPLDSPIPVQPKPTAPAPPAQSRAPKVVQIPVQFVGSNAARSRSGSAVKIQKVFRGFLVRKSVKRIKSIKTQVEEIESKLSMAETVDLIRRDDIEKLRVHEALMSLLLKLDSVRGVDSAVRECRKAVIKKAIALQEKVDDIVSSTDKFVTLEEEVDEDACLDRDDCDEGDDEAESLSEKSVECHEHDYVDSCAEESEQCIPEIKDSAENQIGSSEAEQNVDENPNCEEEVAAESMNEGERENAEDGFCVEKRIVGENWESVVECEDNVKDWTEVQKPELQEEERPKPKGEGEGGDDNKRNRELLERMIEDNEKMMNLMNQLCQRNEVQMRMLNALTHRVELLEKAFVCDRTRRKKKKHSA